MERKKMDPNPTMEDLDNYEGPPIAPEYMAALRRRVRLNTTVERTATFLQLNRNKLGIALRMVKDDMIFRQERDSDLLNRFE